MKKQMISGNAGVVPRVFMTVALVAVLAAGCKKDVEDAPDATPAFDSTAAITRFEITSPVAAQGEIDKLNITVTVPAGTDVETLKALKARAEISKKAAITPDPAKAADYSGNKQVRYTVVAEDGTSAIYTVTVKVADKPGSGEAAITKWTTLIAGDDTAYPGSINHETRTVDVLLPFGKAFEGVTAKVMVSDKATIAPDPKATHDWSAENPKEFTVTAENGTTAKYTVTLIQGADITQFDMTDPVKTTGTLNRAAGTVTFTVPYGTARTAIKAAVTIAPEGAGTLEPNPAEPQNYSNPVVFTLKAGGQPDKAYTVTVNEAEAGTYTVSYASNGGDGGGPMVATSVKFDTAYTLSPNTFTRTGYTFANWNTQADGKGTSYADKATGKGTDNLAPMNGSVTLYAQWTPITYSVVYDKNGGSGNEPGKQTFIYNNTEQKLAAKGDLAKKGSDFEGWSNPQTGTKYAAGQNPGNLTSDAGATVTLYAAWKAVEYDVAFNANGGTGAPGNVKAVYDKAMPAISVTPAKEGHEFNGWFDAATSGTQYYTNKNESAKNYNKTEGTTLYAQWTAITYTVVYDANGATGGKVPAAQSFTYDVAQNLAAQGNLVKTGYTFGGWSESATGAALTDPVLNLRTVEDKFPLYAVWTGIPYTITFSANGGTGAANPTSRTFAYGDTQKLAAQGTLAKTGYMFTGWSTTTSGTKEYDAGQSKSTLTTTSGATVPLYAAWAPIQYTVAYNKNAPANTTSGGTMATSLHTYDTSKNLTANGFTVTGYTFDGWNTQADGKGIKYTNTQSVSNLSAADNGTVQLYAQWKEEAGGVWIGGTFRSDLNLNTLTKALDWVKTNAADNTTYRFVLDTGETSGPWTLDKAAVGNKNNVTIALAGSKAVVIEPSGASLFTVKDDVTLTLDNNITLKGDVNYYRSPLVVVHSNLIMNNGAAIKDNYGGSVKVEDGGTFTMNGGVISGNKAKSNGGGVYVVGTFTMRGGVISRNVISGNTAGIKGGGVYLASASSATFYMYGGVISGNTPDGVYVENYYATDKAMFVKYNTGGIVYGSNAPEESLKNTSSAVFTPKKYRDTTIGANESFSSSSLN